MCDASSTALSFSFVGDGCYGVSLDCVARFETSSAELIIIEHLEQQIERRTRIALL